MTTIVSHHSNFLLNQIISPRAIITVEYPPQSLKQLPPGSLINAEVIVGPQKSGKYVDSIFGQLAIKTNLALPSNSALELQVLRYQPQLQLILRKINGKDFVMPTLTKHVNQNIEKIPGAINVPETVLPNIAKKKLDTIKLDLGTKILAVVIKPNTTILRDQTQILGQRPADKDNILIQPKSQEQTHGAIGANQTTPKNLIAKGLGKAFEELKIFTAKTSIKPMIANTIKLTRFLQKFQPLLKDNDDRTAHSATPLQPGTKLKLNFIGSTQSPSQSAKNKPGPNTINATFVANTPSGQPILNTQLGLLAVESSIQLTTGANLQLEIIPDQIYKPRTTSPTARFEVIFQSKEWVNLLSAIAEIELVSPKIANDLINNTLPKPNSQLASNLLFFLNALKIGNFRSWAGKTASSLLAQIKPQLLTQLEEDFALLKQANTESQTSEWRTAVIPLFTTTGLDQFRLHTQIQSEHEATEELNNGSRFIIDVSLSRIGRIQLDGFLRKKHKRLDLIVRTQKSLPKKMRIEIVKIYGDFSDVSAFTGQVTFQVTKNFTEIPMPQVSNHSTKEIVV